VLLHCSHAPFKKKGAKKACVLPSLSITPAPMGKRVSRQHEPLSGSEKKGGCTKKKMLTNSEYRRKRSRKSRGIGSNGGPSFTAGEKEKKEGRDREDHSEISLTTKKGGSLQKGERGEA